MVLSCPGDFLLLPIFVAAAVTQTEPLPSWWEALPMMGCSASWDCECWALAPLPTTQILPNLKAGAGAA